MTVRPRLLCAAKEDAVRMPVLSRFDDIAHACFPEIPHMRGELLVRALTLRSVKIAAQIDLVQRFVFEYSRAVPE